MVISTLTCHAVQRSFIQQFRKGCSISKNAKYINSLTTFNSCSSFIHNHRSLQFEAAKRVYPHPSKASTGGEDASFCTPRYLGVADGVGSWIEAGIDSGIYSRELLFRIQHYIGIAISSDDASFVHKPSLKKNRQPLTILSKAYQSMKSSGSSTCSLVFLDPSTHTVLSANIGDSGFIVFRPTSGRIIGRSECQQHEHNFPYQLGPTSTDVPEDAQLCTIAVQSGDWIVLATDGLWDNLYDLQITDILKESKTAIQAATSIAEMAFQFSLDECVEEKRFQLSISLGLPTTIEETTEALVKKASAIGLSPRILRAISRIKGGKPDDISVIVAKVNENT